jgi:hypothetical protein
MTLARIRSAVRKPRVDSKAITRFVSRSTLEVLVGTTLVRVAARGSGGGSRADER